MRHLFSNSSPSKRTVVALLLLALTAMQCAFAQSGRLGVQPKSFLVLNPLVQKEIKMTSEQLKKLSSVFGDTVSMDEQGRIRVVMTGAEDLEQLDKDALKVLEAKQLKRLTEIWIQKVGAPVLGTDEIQKALNLDKAKVNQINEEMAAFHQQIQDLVEENNGHLTPEIMAPAQDKLKAKLMALLSKEESDKFSSLKGVEFKFKP